MSRDRSTATVSRSCGGKDKGGIEVPARWKRKDGSTQFGKEGCRGKAKDGIEAVRQETLKSGVCLVVNIDRTGNCRKMQ